MNSGERQTAGEGREWRARRDTAGPSGRWLDAAGEGCRAGLRAFSA